MRANTLYQTIGLTSTDLGLQLQAERAQSAVAVTTRQLTQHLGAQRARTDKSVATFQRSAVEAESSITSDLRGPLDTLLGELKRLGSIRADIDGGFSTRLVSLNEYNRVLDAFFRLYDHISSVPDLQIYQQAVSLQAVGNSREIIAREHALISGALIDGRLTEPEITAFTQYVATRRFLTARGMAGLDTALRTPYEQVYAAEPFRDFTAMETRIVETGKPPADDAAWNSTVDRLAGQLDRLGLSTAATLTERAVGGAASP
ncbi:nitrate- and nitrite sensing domain-containing protein, partial [Nonomuraea rhizosphaerae]|uniref:nitrate- and nitrite sensing domain-containing protein n=1 Tax=Nonomuraea rhizosphaerae TaxID=2665663 RepID=UPI001C5FB544